MAVVTDRWAPVGARTAGGPGRLRHLPIPRSVISQITSRGWLESWWPRAVLTGLLLASLALVVHTAIDCRRESRQPRRHHRRGWRTVRLTVAVAVALVFSVLTLAVYVNSYVGYVPDTVAAERMFGGTAGQAVTSHTTGTVQRYLVGAPALRVPPGATWVYLPPGYAAPGNAHRYPVVYLLHGYPGRSVDWFTGGRIDTTMNLLIGSGAMPPAIVVAPDMNAGALTRDTEGLDIVGGPQVQTYLTTTVPAWVDATFRTLATPAARLVGGMSAGGYVALNLGLRHQNVFGGILAQEPYGDPGRGALAALGGSRAAFAAESPSHYLPTMRFIRQEPTFLDVGSKSGAASTSRLARQLRGRGQPVYFRVEAGQGHTWTEARLGVAYGLAWAARQLGWSALPQPTLAGSGVAGHA